MFHLKSYRCPCFVDETNWSNTLVLRNKKLVAPSNHNWLHVALKRASSNIAHQYKNTFDQSPHFVQFFAPQWINPHDSREHKEPINRGVVLKKWKRWIYYKVLENGKASFAMILSFFYLLYYLVFAVVDLHKVFIKVPEITSGNRSRCKSHSISPHIFRAMETLIADVNF